MCFPLTARISSVLVLGILAIVNGEPESAAAGQINFDNVPSGTIIDNAYPGVTLGCIVCGSGHAFARDMSSFGSSTAATDPNVITLIGPPGSGDTNASSLTSFDGRFGAVTVVFATPQKTVSIQARPQLPLEFLGSVNNKPYMEVYSSTTQNSSTLLGRVLYPLNYGTGGYCTTGNGGCGGPWQTLTFTSPSDNIVSMRLSSQTSQGGSFVYADFDNLTFETTPPPVPLVASLPEASYCANFNSGVPAGMAVFGSAAVSGGYLHLTDASGGLGIAYLNDFNGGAKVSAFTATFKASLFGAACCDGGLSPADGFSFSLVPAATAPAVPDLTQAIEEGLPQGLTVSFDTWDNGGGEAPAIDVKWLGQTIGHAPFQASQSPIGAQNAAAASRDVVINLDEDGTVDVSYGGVMVLTNVQTPYNGALIGAPKWVLGARTGLATDNHWIDDLCVTARAGGKVFTTFDSGIPAGMSLFGDAKVDAGRLKLLSVTDSNGFGIAYIDDFGRGELVKGFHANFQASLFGATCCGGGTLPADGFSFNLVPANSVLSNPGYAQYAEEGATQGLSVNFDTWDNGGGEAPAIGITWFGQTIVSVPFQASQSPLGITDPAVAARNVVIDLKDNGRMDVSYGGTLVISNVATPYDPALIGTPKWVLGARIGGANDNFWFDDLTITTLPAAGRLVPGLYNTGVDAQGVTLVNDAKDSHYVLVLGGTDAFVENSVPGFPVPPWLGDSAVSAWISPSVSTYAPSDGSGTANYRYETKFDLTGFNPGTVRLNGQWATDNNGVDILINGTSTGQLNTNQFAAWTPFQITNGFVAGTNRLTFIVNNGGPGAPVGNDPTGLRAELWATASLNCGAARSAPQITFGPHSGSINLGWAQPGYVLQTAQSITGPWIDSTRGVTVNAQSFTTLVSSTGPTRFFRLRLDCP
jgi:hypothetical protein